MDYHKHVLATVIRFLGNIYEQSIGTIKRLLHNLKMLNIDLTYMYLSE